MLARKVSWRQCRDQVRHCNPTLATIIDSIGADAELPLVHLSLRYGEQIMRQGRFVWPADLDVPCRRLLMAGQPLFLLSLTKQLEVFVDLHTRIVPQQIIQPGQLFVTKQLFSDKWAAATTHNTAQLWSMTAGARSVFMLPKIAEKGGHDKLQKNFHCYPEKPQTFTEHWRVFRDLSQAQGFTEAWHMEVLIFPANWQQYLQEPAFQALRDYLFAQLWQVAEMWRAQVFWHLQLSRIHALREIRSSVYHRDIARHVLIIASGILPGFAPAQSSESLPLRGLQQAYQDVYGLTPWAPVIMQPQLVSTENKLPVYYALQYPSAIEIANKSTSRTSLLTDTFLIASLLKRYAQEFVTPDVILDKDFCQTICASVDFAYYHAEENDYNIIQALDRLPASDTRFHGSGEFPRNSAFFKGCIQILPH